jgi:hypothetical protein
MTIYGLFFRFVESGNTLQLETAHYSMNARKHAEGEGWEFIGEEPICEQIEDVRQSEENRWGIPLMGYPPERATVSEQLSKGPRSDLSVVRLQRNTRTRREEMRRLQSTPAQQ